MSRMLNLAPEIEELSRAGVVPQADAAALVARERREIFSVHPELRVMSWAGAVLVATGVTMLLAQNYERIGPLLLAIAVAVAAAAAYGYAAWRRRSRDSSMVDDSILLLGALLLSGDVAFIEGQFHLLDHGWPRHLLVMAVIHGLTAYYFDSRPLLALSLAALAAWMGIEQRVETIFDSTTETAVRALVCAGAVLMWRAADARHRRSRSFERVFEHFAANLALAGAFMLAVDDGTRPIGVLLTVGIAGLVAWHGLRVGAESFVLYAYAYAVVAIDILVVDLISDDAAIALFLLISSVAAVIGLFALHSAFVRRRR